MLNFSFPKGGGGSNAGWSSPVARKAHNLEVAGSNPAPATSFPRGVGVADADNPGGFCLQCRGRNWQVAV